MWLSRRDRHVRDYAQLSATPDEFEAFSAAIGLMQQTQPNYAAHDLARVSVPVAIVQSEYDEFIQREHAEYLARSIPNAEFVLLQGVSHFAIDNAGQLNSDLKILVNCHLHLGRFDSMQRRRGAKTQSETSANSLHLCIFVSWR